MSFNFTNKVRKNQKYINSPLYGGKNRVQYCLLSLIDEIRSDRMSWLAGALALVLVE